MARIVAVATAGAGGDLPPLAALVTGLARRGHEITAVGDASVAATLSSVGIETRVLPPELDLGPRLVAAIRDATAESGGDMTAAGPLVRERMTAWATETARPVAEIVRDLGADLTLTSLFGVEVIDAAGPPSPAVVVNSTFYVGPGPPRTLEDDFAPRAIPLISRLGSLLGGVELVLHATDRTFDLDFDRLPAHHRYVGPLGIWEPPLDPPRYLDATNEPWALVTLSSQAQDDGPLAQAAVEALASRPFPTVMTLGPAHGPEELRSVPGHVRTERFVSHAAILERGRLLVSHAGHGSVMKALWFGCPMVLVPWGRDQPGVAARADALGVARVVPRDSVSADALGSAIDEVLADELTRTRARQHGERLRATDPAGHAASLVEALL